ncbi:hypothetical protein VFPBJ_04317 [Purpureocillium lilacinum]|uniref:Uncharacterized protein n=1 Tax=Purpureocillium lilacinum TaxID=33203 RepID=A0A179GWR0_PURLI|nr:hypothetical protein VFPBJ_04317 [Purpureocillium lilacinum]
MLAAWLTSMRHELLATSHLCGTRDYHQPRTTPPLSKLGATQVRREREQGMGILAHLPRGRCHCALPARA